MEKERSPRFINMSNSNDKNTSESHTNRGFNLCKSHGGGKSDRDRQSFVISKVSRKDLEDRFYSAIEKNLVLKQLLNKRDEKLKLLGTKLYRLTQQLKKEAAAPEYYQPLGKVLEEQSNRIERLQCEKRVLYEKVNVLKRQISTQKGLISTAKNYKPKRLGSLERQRIINGKGKPDGTKPGVQEDNDYLVQLEEHHPNSPVPDDEDKSEVNNGDDEEFEAENDSQKKNPSEAIASEKSEQLNNSTKCNEPSTSRASFFSKLKCVKSRHPVKDIQVQTSLEKVSKTRDEDIVSEQLAQEHMLVLDLQQQLKSARLTQRVVDEVEELVKVLSSKNIYKEERKVSTDSSFNQKEPTNMVVLRQELQKEKIDLQAQKKMNEQLMSKLSEMQKELDNLNIKFNRASSIPKNFGHKFSPPKSPKHNTISDKSVTPTKYADENSNRIMNGTINKHTNKNTDKNRSTNGSPNKRTNDISNKTTNEQFNNFTNGTSNKITNDCSNKDTYISNQITKDSSIKIVKHVNKISPRKSGRITSGVANQSDKSDGEESNKSDVTNKSLKHPNNIYSKSDQNANNVKSDKNIPPVIKSDSASMISPPPSRTIDPIDNTTKQERLSQNNRRMPSPTTTSKNESIIKRELSRLTEESNIASIAKQTPTKQSDILSTNTEKTSQSIGECSNKVYKSGASSKREGWGSEEIIWSTATLSEIKENDESFDDATYDISKATTFTSGESQSSSPRHTDSTNDDLLSDGEVPKKKSRQSIKCQEINSTQDTLIPKSESSKSQGPSAEGEKSFPESVTEKVEITLTAISKELNRCSELLCSKDHKECNCANNKNKSATKSIGQSKSTTLMQSDTTNENLSKVDISKQENYNESTHVVPLVTGERSQIIQSEQILSSNPTDIAEEIKCNEKGCTKDSQVCDCAEHGIKKVITHPNSQPKLNVKSLGSIYSSRQSKNSADDKSTNKGDVQSDTKLSPLVNDGNRSLILVKVKLHTSEKSPKKQGCDNQGSPKDDKEGTCTDVEATHYSPRRSQHKLSDKSKSSISITEKKNSIKEISSTKVENISKDAILPPLVFVDGSRETIRVEVKLEATHGMETAPDYKEPAKKMNCEEEGCTMGCEVCTCNNTKVISRKELSQNSRQDVDPVKSLLNSDLPEK